MAAIGDIQDRRVSPHLVAAAGNALELSQASTARVPVAIVVSQLANLRQRAACTAFWIQLRGTTQVEAKEGRFRLRRGDWMVFDPDSEQELQADRAGLTAGLLLPSSGRASKAAAMLDHGLFPGRGDVRGADVRLALRLWRTYAAQLDEAAAARAFKPLLLHLRHLQRGLQALVDRCPGRTAVRRHQVLARMQRVRLLLEGNAHRHVRLEELARSSRFSEWWVSKTFHAVYDETVQQASMRVRMRHACELLENTSLSVSELSEACGFHDPCSFARLFKQCHGLTASQWRTVKREAKESQASHPVFLLRAGRPAHKVRL